MSEEMNANPDSPSDPAAAAPSAAEPAAAAEPSDGKSSDAGDTSTSEIAVTPATTEPSDGTSEGADNSSKTTDTTGTAEPSSAANDATPASPAAAAAADAGPLDGKPIGVGDAPTSAKPSDVAVTPVTNDPSDGNSEEAAGPSGGANADATANPPAATAAAAGPSDPANSSDVGSGDPHEASGATRALEPTDTDLPDDCRNGETTFLLNRPAPWNDCDRLTCKELTTGIVIRVIFILFSLTGVWRVVWATGDELYWLLAILYLPLVIETILTLRVKKRLIHECFSPPIFFFLLSIIPSIWLLELQHHHDRQDNTRCISLDSRENYSKFGRTLSNMTIAEMLATYQEVLCSGTWLLVFHQLVLFLVIIAKWMLPAGEMDSDQLYDRVVDFIGVAADILEFTTETLSDINVDSKVMVYIVLAVWTWSMLQFPLSLSGLKISSKSPPGSLRRFTADNFAGLWSTVETLFIQDGPFLLVRLSIMFRHLVIHQMLLFFTVKNLLIVLLNYRRFSVLLKKKRKEQMGSRGRWGDVEAQRERADQPRLLP